MKIVKERLQTSERIKKENTFRRKREFAILEAAPRRQGAQQRPEGLRRQTTCGRDQRREMEGGPVTHDAAGMLMALDLQSVMGKRQPGAETAETTHR